MKGLPTNSRPPVLLRLSGYLGLLFGAVGAFAGASGTGTYIPFREANQLSVESAALLTVISALGAVASILVLISGWGVIRSKSWAPRWNLLSAAGALASVAAFATVMPASSPSPVPGGPGAFVFLAVVSLAYALQVGLLLVGGRSLRVPQRPALPA